MKNFLHEQKMFVREFAEKTTTTPAKLRVRLDKPFYSSRRFHQTLPKVGLILVLKNELISGHRR